MDINLLVNISADTENLYGIQFVNSFFHNCTAVEITLFHICQISKGKHSRELLGSWDNVDSSPAFSAKKALEKAERLLRSKNICGDDMSVKIIRERFGTVKDILNESTEGLYDAMIMGRRATYTLQALFERPGEEIPQAIVADRALACPLWLCCEPEPGRKNVLLCLDGSKSSLRATDHVGFILRQAKEHRVTLYHVSLSSSGENLEKIFSEAEKILEFHNISPERIQRQRGWGISVPGAILAEADQGEYAVIALGLHGISQGRFLQNIGLQACLTTTLLKKSSKSVLWFVP